jgi:hypothetical protein
MHTHAHSLTHASLSHPLPSQQQVSSGRAEHGAVRQALCAALGQECKDFYRFMAVLQGQAQEPIPVPGEGRKERGCA